MNLTFYCETLSLKRIFRVATSAKTDAENIFVEINQEGITGWGEAAPSKFYHEDIQTVPQTIKKIAPLLGNNPLAIQTIHDHINTQIPGNFAAKAAVNMAYYDWIGKRLNIPAYALLGLDIAPQETITSFTIGIDAIERLPEQIEETAHFPLLKIKLGTKHDYRIIEKIRSLTNKPIIIDANEGWSRKEALEKINWLTQQNVLLIEQPLLADDLEGTSWLRKQVNLPLFADESVKTGADIPKLREAFDGINVKLMKCGGITEALRMISTARALGLQVMLGCFIESSLGITAAAHISALCDFVDLDGHLLLKNDPFTGIKINNGRIKLPDKPGLGVERIPPQNNNKKSDEIKID